MLYGHLLSQVDFNHHDRSKSFQSRTGESNIDLP
jgi:hypothetical protein